MEIKIPEKIIGYQAEPITLNGLWETGDQIVIYNDSGLEIARYKIRIQPRKPIAKIAEENKLHDAAWELINAKSEECRQLRSMLAKEEGKA